MEQKKEKWIVDTDPGCDDMMAILYLLSRQNVEIMMISLVDGNVPLAHVSNNSRKILKMSGKTIPLYKGANGPIIRACEHAESYHYCDGLGDIEEIKKYSADDIRIDEEFSALKIVETVMKHPGEINLLCLGPLTNIAAAMMIYPDLPNLLKSVYIMGGSYFSRGNTSPTGEFNFFFDYIAAKMVIPKLKNAIITPWEPTEKLRFDESHITDMGTRVKLGKYNEVMFHFVSLIIAKYTKDRKGTTLCDLYSIIPAFNPNCVKRFSMCKLDIIVDTDQVNGCSYVMRRKEITEKYEDFVRDKLNTHNEEGYHLVIEDFDYDIVFKEYESSFY
jgi:inosine-uridine nucleoside N-ribohydrolase